MFICPITNYGTRVYKRDLLGNPSKRSIPPRILFFLHRSGVKEDQETKEVAHVSSTANMFEWVQIAVFDSGLVVLPKNPDLPKDRILEDISFVIDRRHAWPLHWCLDTPLVEIAIGWEQGLESPKLLKDFPALAGTEICCGDCLAYTILERGDSFATASITRLPVLPYRRPKSALGRNISQSQHPSSIGRQECLHQAEYTEGSIRSHSSNHRPAAHLGG